MWLERDDWPVHLSVGMLRLLSMTIQIFTIGDRQSGNQQFVLVTEMADAGEEHGQAETVGGGDDFGVALRAAGLDDGCRPGFSNFFDAVGKRKECVGGGDGAFQRQL